MIRQTLLLLTLLVSPLVSGADINGFWKHAEEPAWIEIRLAEGKATVVRNDEFPDRVGREILKNLAADGTEGTLWTGQVFADRLGEYRDAEISLPAADRMKLTVKVGFMSRTVEWLRVDEVPTGEVTSAQ